MERILQKKIEYLEDELKDVKAYTYKDIIESEAQIRLWRNKYLQIKQYCEKHISAGQYKKMLNSIDDDITFDEY